MQIRTTGLPGIVRPFFARVARNGSTSCLEVLADANSLREDESTVTSLVRRFATFR
ncbi:MAG: hypothetical protein ACK2T0_15210 [Anaerolineales bacterium]